MSKLKTKLQDLWWSFNMGASVKTINDGQMVEEVVIRYKDYYFGIMIDAKTGEPTGDFVWSTDADWPITPIRDFYTAIPDKGDK